jgi:hypothetical protein
LQLAQTEEGAVEAQNTGSRKHTIISTRFARSCLLQTEGRSFKGTSSIRGS